MKHIITFFLLFFLVKNLLAQCLSTAQAILDINNVSAPITNEGVIGFHSNPMARYTVDTGNGEMSSFLAVGLWVAGLDDNNQLHLAAMRFGQVGNDYFPGPLSTSTGQTDAMICAEYDRIWKLEKWQVEEFVARVGEPGYVIPQEILEWPAHGDVSQGLSYYLAPFFDVDGNGSYEPLQGDYPIVKGDQTLWWVINDAGGLHTESGGELIGLEIRCMAYAVDGCSQIEKTTFYEYELINRGSNLEGAYVGLWVDSDAGYSSDDYIQCDVARNVGFSFDAIQNSYGRASFGLDLLSGPHSDNDGIDNDNDGIVDNENLRMSKFMTARVGGELSSPDDYYNLLQGKWLDGQPMCYGGNGHPSGGADPNILASYMFPGNSDPTGSGTGGVPQIPWTEQVVGSVPSDTRFLISSGPFTLESGSVNDIDFAVVWTMDPTGQDPIGFLEQVDDIIQSAYDSGFTSLPCCPPMAEIHLSQPSVNQFFFSSIHSSDSYFWDFGDGTTSTERFPPSHLFINGTVNEVMLIVTNDCGSDTTYIQVSSLFFGVKDGISDTAFKAYPNPATNEINVEVGLPSSGTYDLILRALDGREVMRRSNISAVRTSLNVVGLNSGVYVLSMESKLGAKHLRIEVMH